MHVGDTHVDEHYAELFGFEFVGVEDPTSALATLTRIAERTYQPVSPSP